MVIIAALATVAANAITLDEAYNRIKAIPEANINDVPAEDCVKEGLDWGKVVIFMGAPESSLSQVEKIVSEITDKLELEITDDNNMHVIAYSNRQENGRNRALAIVNNPGNSMVIVYAQGRDEVVSGIL